MNGCTVVSVVILNTFVQLNPFRAWKLVNLNYGFASSLYLSPLGGGESKILGLREQALRFCKRGGKKRSKAHTLASKNYGLSID